MQIVGYETAPADAGPALLLADAGETRLEPLDAGRELSLSLGDRRCAGAFDGDGHVPCDSQDAPYCETHADTWVCARCTGTCLKDEMDCHEAHAVYLAAFAPATFKVGVTREWRLDTRLREQGADRAAHLRTVPDGRVAREIEYEIARDVGDSVRVDAKVRGLHLDVDDAAWTTLLDRFDPAETYAFDYGLELARQPVRETMAAGTVRGTKGRVLVLDHGGSSYAVDLRDLVGHEVVDGPATADRQSSLGAFG